MAIPDGVPIPEPWRRPEPSPRALDELRKIAQLTFPDDPDLDQFIQEIRDRAKYTLKHLQDRPELVLVPCTLLEQHGADLGFTVAMRALNDNGESITLRAAVLPDVHVRLDQLPAAWQVAITLHQDGGATSAVIGRVTRSGNVATTIELFSKTDQYQVIVPNETILTQEEVDAGLPRRIALHAMLKEEFAQ